MSPQPGVEGGGVEILGGLENFSAQHDIIHMLNHRDREPRVLHRAFGEPLRRAPFFAVGDGFAFKSRLEHVGIPTILPRSDMAFEVEVLKDPGDRVYRLVANHAIRGLHGRNFVFFSDGRSVGISRGQLHHVNPEEMLVKHPRSQAVAVGLGRGIAAKIVKHAQKSRVRIHARRGFLDVSRAILQGFQSRWNVFIRVAGLERVVGVFEFILDFLINSITASAEGGNHDVVGRGQFGERPVVANDVGNQFQRLSQE